MSRYQSHGRFVTSPTRFRDGADPEAARRRVVDELPEWRRQRHAHAGHCTGLDDPRAAVQIDGHHSEAPEPVSHNTRVDAVPKRPHGISTADAIAGPFRAEKFVRRIKAVRWGAGALPPRHGPLDDRRR